MSRMPGSNSFVRQQHGSSSSAPRVLEVKVVVLGHSGVGKTSMLQQYVRGQFNSNVVATIGAAYMRKIVRIGGWDVCMMLWDTAGQERFRSMVPMYYRGAQAAVLVFDVTAPATLGKAHEWVLELQAHTDVGGYGFYRSPSIGVSSGDLRNGGDGSVDTEEEPLVLVVAANKSDLKDSTAASGGVAVDMGAALRYASSIGASLHETSAVTGSGLEELFNELAKKLLQAHLERTGADAQGKDVWQRAADQAAKAGTSVGVHVGPTPPVAVGSGRRCCS